MVQCQITLSDDANQFVQDQLATGRFASVDEVVSKVLEDARVRAAKAKLAELIREGIESGPAVEATDEWWQQLRAKIRAEAERRRSA
jgi:antitoxin ParD1/3/4